MRSSHTEGPDLYRLLIRSMIRPSTLRRLRTQQGSQTGSIVLVFDVATSSSAPRRQDAKTLDTPLAVDHRAYRAAIVLGVLASWRLGAELGPNNGTESAGSLRPKGRAAADKARCRISEGQPNHAD